MVQQKNDTIISPAGNKTVYIDSFGPVYFNIQKLYELCSVKSLQLRVNARFAKLIMTHSAHCPTVLAKSAVKSSIASNNHTNERYVLYYIIACIMLILCIDIWVYLSEKVKWTISKAK